MKYIVWLKSIRLGFYILIFVLVSVAALFVATYLSIKPFPADLNQYISASDKKSYLDRHGKRMNITYENSWNVYDVVSLHQVPQFLQDAFIVSEDKRFFKHHGADWLARFNAVKQNIQARNEVRGASTITEQVVRMIHPRPRTIWSRWVEGFEATLLERHFSKLEIFEFYINQVPYKAKRRGIAQAAQYYFDRDIDTLNKKEMMALAVLVRSPQWLDPDKKIKNLDRFITDLANRMDHESMLGDSMQKVSALPLILRQGDDNFNIEHFITFANSNLSVSDIDKNPINTTLDLELQLKVQQIMDSQLTRLTPFHVQNGAVLVVDHETNEILSWVVGYSGKEEKAFNKINAVLAERQPGSALKPFLYANALMRGWTAATMLDDSPLEEGVGSGMHSYHNYSHEHYGLISLREALGNSLNIPAVKTIQFLGTNEFLNSLSEFGIKSLSGHPNVYGDGLALGNGEVTLYELVQAYTVLARMGNFKALTFKEGDSSRNGSENILSEDVASLIADILSDPDAREKEFGMDSILNFPNQTAVKTGTSSDYRDAWAVGFNDKYTVGVWMGNLDYSDMQEITGSLGPAMVLRSVFSELNRNRDVKSLYFSKNLEKQRVCIDTGLPADDTCESRDEWFIPGTSPRGAIEPYRGIRITKPSKGLMLAMDPRIPDDHEYFEFSVTDDKNIKQVKWFINGKLVATKPTRNYNWKLAKGTYITTAEILLSTDKKPILTDPVEFTVN